MPASVPERNQWKENMKLFVKFCGDQWPSALLLRGISRSETLIGTGGFADVYKGHYQGKAVALKSMRYFVNGDSEGTSKSVQVFSAL